MKKQYSFFDWLISRPFYDAQPDWTRKLIWFAGVPAWLVLGYFIVSGTVFEHQALAMIDFAVFMAVSLVTNFHFLRGTGRGDRNG